MKQVLFGQDRTEGVMRSTLSFLLIAMIAGAAQAQRDTPCHELPGSEASIVVAPPEEPGVRLVITGRVLGEDREPVPNARVLAYHTDSRGYYSVGGMDERNARLCGVLVTDPDGSYRIETIRPAHYATGGGPAAHVHFEVELPHEAEQTRRSASFTLNFEGDPRLDGSPSGERWDRIRPVETGEDGIGSVERDLWVR